jgi:hypothetical protein
MSDTLHATKWALVEDEFGVLGPVRNTTRLRVPGGWVYRVVGYTSAGPGAGAIALVLVPEV